MMSKDLVAIVAIVAPFLFAAWVIKTGVKSRESKRRAKEQPLAEGQQSDVELETEIEKLERRISNLEIILRDQQRDER